MFKESVTLIIIKTTIVVSWQICKNYPHLLFTSEKNSTADSTASGESAQQALVTNNTLQVSDSNRLETWGQTNYQ